MDMEMLKRLFENASGEGIAIANAKDDPIGWVEAQLESNNDLAFVEKDTRVWECRSLKRGRMIEIQVTANEGKVSAIASIDITPDEKSLLPIRIFQMLGNGSFKWRGYLPARVGERISYGATHAIKDGFDVGTLIDRVATTIAFQADDLEKINAGADVKAVYWEERRDRISRSARLHHALGE